jgi:hypothetical protein
MDWGEIKEIRMIMTKGTRGRWQASGLHPFMLQPLAFSPSPLTPSLYKNQRKAFRKSTGKPPV